MNKIFCFEHTNCIKLITVELRVFQDIFLKKYSSKDILIYVGDKSILFVCKLYFLVFSRIIIYG